MNNYEYIIASLPAVSLDCKSSDKPDGDAIIAEIRENLSASDTAKFDLLLKGFDGNELTPEFYDNVLDKGFLGEYFKFDLAVRNAKVRYLNNALGRPSDQDIFLDLEEEYEEQPAVEAALNTADILGRERALDDLMWNKIDSLTTFDYFNLDAILGFTAKLHIIERWLNLDEAAGREMFRRLIAEVRGTFKGVEYNEK